MIRTQRLAVCIHLVIVTIAASYFSDHPEKAALRSNYTLFPMLFFGQDDLDNLRQKAITTHRHIASELESAVRQIRQTRNLFPPKTYAEFGKNWNEVYGNNLPPLALCFLLKPDPEVLTYIKGYMDRMTSYSSWLVIGMETDEVPVSHHLIGFATAYDMLYQYLDTTRKIVYGDKIVEVTKFMYDMSKKRTWGKYYLQNHQASNVVSLLVGSLVSGIVPGANTLNVDRWRTKAVTLYERTMSLLELIDDGSLNEGVGYVGYTVRSLTQYVYLMKRHMGVDHTSHPWLRRHFEYMYYTIIPGMGRTIGIADSPQAWFYGPESQLHFLDAYILKDGRANWLAMEIKKNKIPTMNEHRPPSQRYVTLHTEFLFYDADIGTNPPPGYLMPEFHHFTDWGVATYRSGSILDSNSSYVSFKSSRIHGKAISNLANSVHDKDLKGWKAFNPGHEHPDQNSFTFWAGGEPFISESMYAEKYPYMDNTLMFRGSSPQNTTPCVYPWTGQLGSCQKWLTWQGKEEASSFGEILAAERKNGIAFMIGDSHRAYPSYLGLMHVYRGLLVLDDGLLVVLDHVVVTHNSKLTHLSAYFNNFMHRFISTKHKSTKLSGLRLNKTKNFTSLWLSAEGQSPLTSVTNYEYKSSGKHQITSNANVTFSLEGTQTSIMYVFAAPGTNIKKVSFRSLGQKMTIALQTNHRHVSIHAEFSDKVSLSVKDENTQKLTTFGSSYSSGSYDSTNYHNVKVMAFCVFIMLSLFYCGKKILRLCYRILVRRI